MTDLRFSELTRVNRERRDAWHAEGDDWTISDWSNAMAGEAGEICNAVKKLRRIESRIRSKNAEGRQIDTREQAIEKIGAELADTLLYLDLIALHLGIDLPGEIIKKFNSVSDEYGFPHKLKGE